MKRNKKKIILIIIMIIAVIIIDVGVFLTINSKNNSNIQNKSKSDTECIPMVGGGFDVIFNTNGGNRIENISVCPTCAPEDFKELPTPIKSNSKFLGWYYDSEFTKQVIVTNTSEVDSKQKLDEKGCQVGYEDVTLYAKWG